MKATLSTGEKLIQEGFTQGWIEGWIEEVIEGRRQSLLEALHHRFGRVPADVERRIAQATDAELRSWLARTFTAATLDQVFA